MDHHQCANSTARPRLQSPRRRRSRGHAPPQSMHSTRPPLANSDSVSIHIRHWSSKQARPSTSVNQCRSSVPTRKIRLGRHFGCNSLIAMPETNSKHRARHQAIPPRGEIPAQAFDRPPRDESYSHSISRQGTAERLPNTSRIRPPRLDISAGQTSWRGHAAHQMTRLCGLTSDEPFAISAPYRIARSRRAIPVDHHQPRAEGEHEPAGATAAWAIGQLAARAVDILGHCRASRRRCRA